MNTRKFTAGVSLTAPWALCPPDCRGQPYSPGDTWPHCPPDRNEYSKYLQSPSELVERPGLSDLAYTLSWREMEMEDEEHGYEDPSGWMNYLPSSLWFKIPSGLPSLPVC